MKCQRSGCGHVISIHNDDGCRKTGCECEAFVPVEEQVGPQVRRITVDVPDGYMLTVSLVPYTESKSEPET